MRLIVTYLDGRTEVYFGNTAEIVYREYEKTLEVTSTERNLWSLDLAVKIEIYLN